MANLEPTQSSADVLADESSATQDSPSSSASRDAAAEGGEGSESGNGSGSGTGGGAGGGLRPGVTRATGSASPGEREGDKVNDGDDALGESMSVQSDVEGEGSDETFSGEENIGKRVKVYELRDQAWFDRGTGRCKGVYDDQNDVALIIVEAEDLLDGRGGDDGDGPGGFLKDELLLNTHVSKDDTYSRQQDTLIVWTDQATQQDIALSFQDPEGCEDIFQFIVEVQKHLNNQLGDEPSLSSASSPPLATSPLLSVAGGMGGMARDQWQPPSLANIKEHELWLRMQAKSAAGRERAVEHIIGDEYIKQLIGVFNQAEDLESLDDLHALCSLMQTILMFNDHGIFEYILQDDVFLGVLGMLEYDPEFPTLKASYRAFFREFSKFRQVVDIKNETVKKQIHQTSRLLYLKDVVLARVLDDPTFGILNSFVFFNQSDITTYIQSDESLLLDLFFDFRREKDEPQYDAKKRDIVTFLHQLMLMGKGIQVTGRLALYRTLLDRGLLFACEWAFRQTEATILHAGAEILTIAVEHDVNAIRIHILREEELKRRTLVMEIIGLLQSSTDQGLIQQSVETLKTLLEPGPDSDVGNAAGSVAERRQAFGRAKELSVIDTFSQYFYDLCAAPLFAPIADLPEIKDLQGPPELAPARASLLTTLIDLLSYCVVIHASRAQYYILSNPLAQKVWSLIYAREKTLRHSSLRFIKACLRTGNHFIHRNFAKNGVTRAILDLVERETNRDTMLSSACLDTLEMIRKDNMKPIIGDMFEKYEAVMLRLAERPYVRQYVLGLRVRWEQYNEPLPPPPPQVAESSKARTAAEEEEAWFHQSDEEEATPSPEIRTKRKRSTDRNSSSKRLPPKPSAATLAVASTTAAGGSTSTATTTVAAPSPSPLGLDYDDASDSDSSTGGESPKIRPAGMSDGLADELADVEMKVRAKRLRDEEESDEGGFAGLLGGGGGVGGGGGGKGTKVGAAALSGSGIAAEGKESATSGGGLGGGGGGAGVSPGGKEKKIRLSLGGLSKKFGGGKV